MLTVFGHAKVVRELSDGAKCCRATLSYFRVRPTPVLLGLTSAISSGGELDVRERLGRRTVRRGRSLVQYMMEMNV